MDPDQARHFVGPDLGPKCLQKLSANNTRRYELCLQSTAMVMSRWSVNLPRVGLYQRIMKVLTSNPITIIVECKNHMGWDATKLVLGDGGGVYQVKHKPACSAIENSYRLLQFCI